MNLSELTNLASIVNNNEDVIVNKTTKLRDEVRDWCIGELTKIEAEEKKVVDFINANRNVFIDKCGTPYLYKFGMEYSAQTGGGTTIFKTIGVVDQLIRFEGYDPYFKAASVHSWKNKVQGCFDCMNGNIEYWTRMKKCIDFRRWQLDFISVQLKKLIESLIDEQKKRMDGIVKTCEEIDNEKKDENPCVEVTISIRKAN